MIAIGKHFKLKENRDALKLYYDEYKPQLDKLCPISYEDFAEHNKDFDIFGLYNDNNLCGCIYFEVMNNNIFFHVAVDSGVRGKWSFTWPQVKKWMIDRYNQVFSVTHREDAYTNRLIARSGFTYIEATDNFYWWRLWAEQPV